MWVGWAMCIGSRGSVDDAVLRRGKGGDRGKRKAEDGEEVEGYRQRQVCRR